MVYSWGPEKRELAEERKRDYRRARNAGYSPEEAMRIRDWAEHHIKIIETKKPII